MSGRCPHSNSNKTCDRTHDPTFQNRDPERHCGPGSDGARLPYRHIADIAARGRMAWQKASGYNQRSRGETLMGRWKAVIGPKLKARAFEKQKTEGKIGVRVLNRMTELGRPQFERTA
jgi:hypothetical protein